MQVSLSSELKRFVEEQLNAGVYSTPEDVLRAAVAALRQAERFGDFAPEELDALLAKGEHSLDGGGAVDADETFDELRRRSAERREGQP